MTSQLEDGPQSSEVDLGTSEGAAKALIAKGMLAMKYRIFLGLGWFFGATVRSGVVEEAFVCYTVNVKLVG